MSLSIMNLIGSNRLIASAYGSSWPGAIPIFFPPHLHHSLYLFHILLDFILFYLAAEKMHVMEHLEFFTFPSSLLTLLFIYKGNIMEEKCLKVLCPFR